MELQLESNTVKERWESRLIQEMEENGIEDKESKGGKMLGNKRKVGI